MPNEAVTRIIENLEDEIDKLKHERARLQREVKQLKVRLQERGATP